MKEYLIISTIILLLYFTGIYLKKRNRPGDRYNFWSSIIAIIAFSAALIVRLLKKEDLIATIIISFLYVVLVIYLAVKAFKSYKKMVD